MASLVSLIVIFTLSALITKIASVALVHTGLSKEVATFQARSAFTGVGFTTNEAENIVNHPVRRRIVMTLMIIGNVGIISAIASLILTFVNTKQDDVTVIIRLLILFVSLGILWRLSKSRWLENKLVIIINMLLRKFTSLRVKDYVELLKLNDDYEITVIKVKKGDWLENKKVSVLKLRQEGINLIGIERKNGTYVGTPSGDTTVTTEDKLILYGRERNLRNLEKRKQDVNGQQQHEQAMEQQKIEKERQKKKDKSVKK